METTVRRSGDGITLMWNGDRAAVGVVRVLTRLAMFCSLIAAATPPAEAQQLASSFAQLSVLVKPGDTVTVTDSTGRETRGIIAALSPSSFELTVAGSRRAFLEDETRTIRQRRSDSLKNGALWGVAVGAGLGLLTLIDTEPTAGDVIASTALMAGLGTAVGFGIDAIFSSNDLIFVRSPRASARFTVSPFLSRGSAGARVSLGF